MNSRRGWRRLRRSKHYSWCCVFLIPLFVTHVAHDSFLLILIRGHTQNVSGKICIAEIQSSDPGTVTAAGCSHTSGESSLFVSIFFPIPFCVGCGLVLSRLAAFDDFPSILSWGSPKCISWDSGRNDPCFGATRGASGRSTPSHPFFRGRSFVIAGSF